MELEKKKIMKVKELQRPLSFDSKNDFVLSFGTILLTALRNYKDGSSFPEKIWFSILLNMADFTIDNDLYEVIIMEFEKKSWIEEKVINFLKKRGKYQEREIDINELISIGTTHYYQQGWGGPKELKEALTWFASELA